MMFRKTLSAALLLTASIYCSAQTRQVDSLLKIVDVAAADSDRLNALTGLGSFYMSNNTGKAVEYFEKSIAIAKKINDQKKLGRLYILNGFSYRIKADFDKSLENYLKATRVYEKENFSNKLSAAYISVADVYSDIKNVKKATEYYDKAEVVIVKQKDSFELSHLYFAKGILFGNQKEGALSMQYFQNAYQIGKNLNSDMVVTNTLSAIGTNYKNRGNIAAALKCYDTVKLIYEKNGQNSADIMASLYINYGEAYREAKDFNNAKKAFEKSIEYATGAGLTDIVMSNYKNLALLYGANKDYAKQVYYLQKHYDIKDGIYTSDSKIKLTELEADYNIEKKNIEIVKKDAEVQQQKNQRNLFIMLAFAAAMILIALATFNGRIKKKNAILFDNNIVINKQKDELLKLNGVKDRLFSIISHDLRNPMVTLRSYLTLSENKNISDEQKLEYKNQTVQAVAQTTDMLDNLLAWANMQIKDTRATITQLDVEDVVLDALDNVQAQATQKNISIHKNLIAQTIPADKNILNIALCNVLTNAIKYSHKNGSIFIDASEKNNSVLLSVRDEGVGMSATQIQALHSNENESSKGTAGEKGSGLGIFLIKELLQKINGELLVESEQGKGSTFSIKLAALNS